MCNQFRVDEGIHQSFISIFNDEEIPYPFLLTHSEITNYLLRTFPPKQVYRKPKGSKVS